MLVTLTDCPRLKYIKLNLELSYIVSFFGKLESRYMDHRGCEISIDGYNGEIDNGFIFLKYDFLY